MRCDLWVLVVAVYVGVALGQNDILKEKWGLVFDYLNLVKQTDGSEEIANFADFQKMKDKLESSAFRSVANDLPKIFYPPNIQNPDTVVGQTKKGMIDDLAGWNARADTSILDIYSRESTKIFLYITDVTGTPLTREAYVAFTLVVGSMDEASAGEAFDKMIVLVGKSGAQEVNMADYSSAHAKYFGDETVSAKDLPLFGKP